MRTLWAILCGLKRGSQVPYGGSGNHLDRCPNKAPIAVLYGTMTDVEGPRASVGPEDLEEYLRAREELRKTNPWRKNS